MAKSIITDTNIDPVLLKQSKPAFNSYVKKSFIQKFGDAHSHAHGNHDRFRGGDAPLFLPVIIDGRFSYSLSIHTAAISPENMTSST
jgi:hypothetical protein